MHSSEGSILIAVLILSTLIAGLILGSYHYHTAASLIAQGRLHAAKAKIEASADTLGQFPMKSSYLLSCSHGEAQVGKHLIQRALCVNWRNTERAVTRRPLPMLNYSQIFSSPHSCQMREAPSFQVTPGGFHLSHSSIVSDQLCGLTLPENWENVSVLGNLSVSSPVLSRTQSSQANTIAASGFLEIPSLLTLEHDTIVLAGGDLYVREINLAKASSIRIVLFSASGVVQVDQISPGVKVNALGYLGALVPEHTEEHRELLTLPPLHGIVVGLYPGNRDPISRRF